MKIKIVKFLCSFFGAGFVPVAPGSFTSLIIFVLAYLSPIKFHSTAYDTAVLIIFVGSFFLAKYILKYEKQKDPAYFVFDEVLGSMLVVCFLPKILTAYVVGFFAFRFFDILKIPPIRWIEKRMPNAWGIILDDIVAAFYTVLLISIMYNLAPAFSL